MQIPSDLKYTETHEWVREEEDGSITVGLSDPMQALLGEIVFVELPEIDQEVKVGEEIGVVESVSESIELYSPLSGTIIEVNEALREKPDLTNLDAYHDGWIFKMMPHDLESLKDLLDFESYEDIVAHEL
jgi:glycine cleavage system H protein